MTPTGDLFSEYLGCVVFSLIYFYILYSKLENTIHFQKRLAECPTYIYIFWFLCRKMQIPGATDLASKSQSSSDINQVKPGEEVNDLYQNMKVRCLCGSPLVTDSMIQVVILFYSII